MYITNNIYRYKYMYNLIVLAKWREMSKKLKFKLAGDI